MQKTLREILYTEEMIIYEVCHNQYPTRKSISRGMSQKIIKQRFAAKPVNAVADSIPRARYPRRHHTNTRMGCINA